MKKNLFFTFAMVAILMAGVISCTNEYFEEELSVATKSKSIAKRAGVEMTKEEVQTRLDEIGKKYGININMLYARDYSEFTEKHFEQIEKNIIAEQNGKNNEMTRNAIYSGENLINDDEIDEYGIATLSNEIEDTPEYEDYKNICIKYFWGKVDDINGNDYKLDKYIFGMGIKYSDETGRLKAVAEFTDISEDENKYRCELHSFRNETILYYQTGKFYFFDLKMDIYKKNSQTPHSKNTIYGTYDAGISNIYTTSSNFQIGFTI